MNLIFFLILLLLFTNIDCFNRSSRVGSVFFYKRSSQKCWSHNDLAKLRARMIFEKIMLPVLPPDKIDTKYNKNMIVYFKKALRQVEHKKDNAIIKEALADTIGAHMRKDILPTVRFAYYAGYIPFKSVNELHEFFQTVKKILNTQGLGWQEPYIIPMPSNLTVAKILLVPDKSFDPCEGLIIKRYNKNCMYIPVPIVDNERQPAALALPYTTGGFVSLSSPSSESILLKYYTKAARCILHSSPDECRHGDFVNFNNELWHWLKRYVAPHLMDEELYSGYGGVLRIAAAVQNYSKGLSRRHLFYHKKTTDDGSIPSHMFSINDNKYFTDQTCTPPFCVMVILGAALAVCCLHILYNFVCGPTGACNCPGRGKQSAQLKKDIAYANVNSKFPTMLPPQSNYTEQSTHQDARSCHQSQTTSVGTTKKDLNAPKVMSVLMSDKELSETESLSTDEENTTMNRTLVGSIRTSVNYERPPRSPEVKAPVTKVKIERTPPRSPRMNRNIRTMYSTTNVSLSEVTNVEQMSESCWSESSTTERSGSSFNTSSRGRPLRRSRDIEWAKKVVRKQNLRSGTATEFDFNSNTAPTTRR